MMTSNSLRLLPSWGPRGLKPARAAKIGGLDAGLKASSTTSFIPIHDAAPVQVVGRKLHGHPVAWKYFDEVLAHFAGDVRQNLVLVLQLNLEHGIGQRLDHHRHDFNRVFLTHSAPENKFSAVAETKIPLRVRPRPTSKSRR